MNILVVSAALSLLVSAGTAFPRAQGGNELVVSLVDLEGAVGRAAVAAQVSTDVVSAALRQFRVENEQRLIRPGELRAAFLEILYQAGVPYARTQTFLTSLREELGGPRVVVDTGFVARQVDLTGRTVLKIGAGVRPPKVVENPNPSYTAAARNAAVEGVVIVRCVVLADGTVANLKVERGVGYGLDESAVRTIQDRWRFEPATAEGKPVAVEAHVEVRFRLN
jgi:TonB family protein